MKRFICIIALVLFPVLLFSEAMYSPTWGFKINLPEGYEYLDGDGRDRFSFLGPSEAMFDIVVYHGTYPNVRELAADINRRLSNSGNTDFFTYNDKQAAIIELVFGEASGWGLCVELDVPANAANASPRPLMVALAYGPANDALSIFHMSALDSIIPSDSEQYFPGPIMFYSFPRGDQIIVPLGDSGVIASIYQNDAEAAQVLVEREFNILVNYLNTPFLKEAWIRYYRTIYRDSRARIGKAALALANRWNGNSATTVNAKREFAQRALRFVQGFEYERDPSGSDFLNLVSAITEGRGDCDSRAMLWAIILASANINAGIMISPHYSHAMGLADIGGSGARFEAYEINWLVAETTDSVDIGLIAQDHSDPNYWFAVIFE